MSLADVIANVVGNVAAPFLKSQGLTVQCKITVNGTHGNYNPVTEATTEGGTLLPIQGLRYQEKLNLSTGLTVHHHKTDGTVQFTEMLMLFAVDLAGNVVKQDDFVQILEGATWVTWQIKTVDTPPTRPVFICVIQKS